MTRPRRLTPKASLVLLIPAGLVSFGILGLSSCAKQNSTASASTEAYYVDASSGNDSNDGKSSATPWQTLAKVNSTEIPSGAVIYLKRGSTWHETLTLSQNGISVAAYGSGALPVIDGSSGFIYTATAGTLFSQMVTLGSGQGLGNVSENGTMLKFVAWNTNSATTFSAAPNGSYSYDFATSTLYVKPAVTGTATYLTSKQLYGIRADSLSGISISDVQIQRFSLHGIELKNCAGCSVKNSTIQKGGGAVIGPNSSTPPDYLYAGNGIEFGNSSSSGTVDNVTVSEIFDSCVTPQTYSSSQTASGFTITNSTLDRCGFAGIEVSVLSNGGSTGSSISNVTVSGVTITNAGQGWSGQRYGTEGHGIKLAVDSGAGSLSGVTITQSSISGCAGDGIHVAGAASSTQFSRLKIKGNHYGISFIEPTSSAPKLVLSSSLIYSNLSYGVLFNVPNGQGFQIINNTFYGNTTINLGILSQAGTADLRNNLFSAGSAMTHLYVLSTLNSPTVDYNCYTDMANAFGYNGSAYSTMSAFHTATSLESHGTAGTVALVDPSTENFRLGSTSACISSGTPLAGANTDYAGSTFLSPPSSGAYQY